MSVFHSETLHDFGCDENVHRVRLEEPFQVAEKAESFAGNFAISFGLDEFHRLLDSWLARRLLRLGFVWIALLLLGLLVIPLIVALVLLAALIALLLALLHVLLSALFAGESWLLLLSALLLGLSLLCRRVVWLLLLRLLRAGESCCGLLGGDFCAVHGCEDGVELRFFLRNREPCCAEKCFDFTRDVKRTRLLALLPALGPALLRSY